MKIYLDCIPCFMHQALRAGRAATSDEKKIKQILDKTGEMVKIVANSNDKLLTAIKIAIAGNVIDLGVKKSFDIAKNVKSILKQDFAIFDYSAFKIQLGKTENILYIGDNAGESVFDKILIKELKKPVKYAVRSIPIINDVTMEDAIGSGLGEVAELIDSGCESPGIILNQSTPEFFKFFNTSGLIISKGQGNFEGLSDCNQQVFFLLKAKCTIISNHLGVEEGSIILKKHHFGRKI